MKSYFIKTLFFTLAICLLAPNLSAWRRRPPPDWLDNPHNSYPESQYIVAIGSGEDRSSAEANAAANISRIFQTNVKTEEFFQERYKEIVSGASFLAETTSDIDKEIYLSSDQTLFNLRFGDSYTDNQGIVHVLAYINRVVTTDIYLEMINNHIERVLFYKNKYEQTENALQKYAYISAASIISTANEMLIEQLRIIAPHHQVRLNYDHNSIIDLARNAAQLIPFSITVTNDKNDRIKALIAEMITSRGFLVSDTGSIAIQGEVTIENLELPRPEKFVRWQIILNVIDTDGSSLVSHSQRGREGHLTQSEAVARAFRAMEKEINNEFSMKLFNFFDGLSN